MEDGAALRALGVPSRAHNGGYRSPHCWRGHRDCDCHSGGCAVRFLPSFARPGFVPFRGAFDTAALVNNRRVATLFVYVTQNATLFRRFSPCNIYVYADLVHVIFTFWFKSNSRCKDFEIFIELTVWIVRSFFVVLFIVGEFVAVSVFVLSDV